LKLVENIKGKPTSDKRKPPWLCVEKNCCNLQKSFVLRIITASL